MRHNEGMVNKSIFPTKITKFKFKLLKVIVVVPIVNVKLSPCGICMLFVYYLNDYVIIFYRQIFFFKISDLKNC